MIDLRLSDKTADAIRTAQALVARDRALCELCVMIDPDRRLSTNGRAEALASALRRFERAAYPRIAQGCRAPRSAFEEALCAVLAAPGPRSSRKLFDLLAELGF